MVTAVEPNMVGILRRLHLHPMDAALNEFTSQMPISQLHKFSPDPFLFSKQTKSENDQFHTSSAHKRSTSKSLHTDPPSKKNRRLTRVTPQHTHQSVPCLSGREKSDVNFTEQRVATPTPSPMPACSPSDYLLPTPTLYTPSSTLGKRSLTHGTPSWLAYPPTLSNPKTPISLNHESVHIDCKHSNIEPILSAAASLLQLRTPISRAEPLIAPIQLANHTRRRTPSATSTGENFSDASESTASMPNVTGGLNGLDTNKRQQFPYPSDTPVLDSCNSQLRLRSSFRTSKAINSSDHHNKITSNEPDTVKIESIESGQSSKPLKRRRSFDQLTEPSIHGLPDSLTETKLRERRSTQFLQLESKTHPTLHNYGDRSYLHTHHEYYIPDFSLTKSSGFSHDKLMMRSACDERCADEREDTAAILIEVPSWRILTVDNVRNACLAKNISSKQVMNMLPDTSRNTRALRTGVVRHSIGATGKNKPTSEGSTCSASSSVRSLMNPLNVENISDTAYMARHSRLETEEIRRERRSRQRTKEQELKLRWEQRDQASWHKRQPQSRVDPLAKYNPQDRMPTHLTPAFNQIRHLHVCDSLPVIAFGCRVPVSSIQPFKRSST